MTDIEVYRKFEIDTGRSNSAVNPWAAWARFDGRFIKAEGQTQSEAKEKARALIDDFWDNRQRGKENV